MRFMIAFALALGSLSASTAAFANPILLNAPSVPVPPYSGTGLHADWAHGGTNLDFTTLDTARLILQTGTTKFGQLIGPIDVANGILPLGDFPGFEPMPFSLTGVPISSGERVVGHFHGSWSVRTSGTYTIAVGSDDGYRVVLQSVVVIDRSHAQSFQRASATVVVPAPGLVPLDIEYFNGIQEGAIEVAFAPGEIALASAYSTMAPTFQLIPVVDLYPESGIAVDAGTAPPPVDAGAADAGDARDAGDAAVTGDTGPSDSGVPDASDAMVEDAGGDTSPPSDSGSALVAHDAAVHDAATSVDATSPTVDTTSDSGTAAPSIVSPDVEDHYYGGGCSATDNSSTGAGFALVAGLMALLHRKRRTS